MGAKSRMMVTLNEVKGPKLILRSGPFAALRVTVLFSPCYPACPRGPARRAQRAATLAPWSPRTLASPEG
jgi:hypothetical protein